MVRLRSDRWYSADGQGRSRASVRTTFSGNRRVLSLCLLLALVVVLMRNAADPKHVKDAFQALGVPLEEQAKQPSNHAAVTGPANHLPSTGAGSPNARESVPPAVTLDQSLWLRTCQDLVPRLLGDATSAEIDAISSRWFGVGPSSTQAVTDIQATTGEPAPHSLQRLRDASTLQLDELVKRFHTDLQGLPASEQATSLDWASHLEQFASQWQVLWNVLDAHADRDAARATDDLIPSRASLRQELRAELSQFLDQRLLTAFRDATPWTKSESTTFWRLLQRGQGRDATAIAANSDAANSDTESPLINTLQLESETSAYRGQTIRYRGTIRRADWIDRGDANFGIESYWSLWLRGDDDAVQPITVYTTHSIAKQLQQALLLEQTPRVEVLGIVGKRLAYAAEDGVEVAPTIFATSIIQFADETAPIGQRADSDVARDFGWSLLIGGCVAACILLPIAANWRKRATRAMLKSSTKLMVGWILLGGSAPLFAQSANQATANQATANQATANQATGELPPWARQDNQPSPDDILTARLTEALTGEAGDAIRALFRDQPAGFPDAALKILHALRQVGWEGALRPDFSGTFPEAKLTTRLESIDGWVRLATPVPIEEQQQLWFQQDTAQALFRLEVETSPSPSSDGHSPRLQTIYCTEVPSQWLTAVRLRQPVTVSGLSLRDQENLSSGELEQSEGAGSALEKEPLWCMFAQRPRWKLHPSTSPTENFWPPWTDRQQQLAQLGWDLMHLGTVERYNQQPLRAQETEAYYSLLRGLGQSKTLAGTEHSLFELLAERRPLVGAHVLWTVRLVSGAVVEVPNPQHQKWLGSNRYFQFDGMLDMGQQVVDYKLPGTAEQAVRFEGEFPVTIVMRETSSFVPAEMLSRGERNWSVGEYVQVSGLFYRLWSYESELMSGQSTPARQAAPLIMAHRMTPTAPPVRQVVTSTGWFGYALSLATVALLAGILWTIFQKPKRRLHYR